MPRRWKLVLINISFFPGMDKLEQGRNKIPKSSGFYTIDHNFRTIRVFDMAIVLSHTKWANLINGFSCSRISCVCMHLGERPTLNSCALSHWLPHLPITLIPRCSHVCRHFYVLFSVIYTATLCVVIWLFTCLSAGLRRIRYNGRKLVQERYVY